MVLNFRGSPRHLRVCVDARSTLSMRLNEACNQAKFALDVGLERVESRIFGGQYPQLLEVARNTGDGGVVSREQFFVSSEDKVLGGVAGPKNLSRDVFKKSFDFAGVSDSGLARRQAVGGAENEDAAGDKQCNGNAKS